MKTAVSLCNIGFIDLDYHIAPLVEVLSNKFNVRTLFSCQGHWDKIYCNDFESEDYIILAKFPWVIFEREDFQIVKMLISDYDNKLWQVCYQKGNATLTLKTDPKNEKELKLLQKEAIRLACFFKKKVSAF